MPSKEEYPEQGLCLTTLGRMGKHQAWSGGRKERGGCLGHSLNGGFHGKGRGRVRQTAAFRGLARLSQFQWVLLPSCLVPGCGMNLGKGNIGSVCESYKKAVVMYMYVAACSQASG